MPFIFGERSGTKAPDLEPQATGRKAALGEMSYQEAIDALAYTVVRGDTLGKVAHKTMGSAGKWRQIYEANRDVIANPNVISVGQTLSIPRVGAPAPKAPVADAPAPAVAPAVEEAPDGTYTVGRGDTLHLIAEKTLGTSKRWVEIYHANMDVISNPSSLRAGWTLTIPGMKANMPEVVKEVSQAPGHAPTPAPKTAPATAKQADPDGTREVAMQITEVIETGGCAPPRNATGWHLHPRPW